MVVRFQKQIGITLTVFLIFISVFSVNLTPVHANEGAFFQLTDAEDTECIGVDLILVVDQSGSMSSYTDKEGFRALATQNILQRFATNVLLECPGAVHRIAILNFGNENEWTRFTPPQDPGPIWVEVGGFGSYTDVLEWQTDWLEPKLNVIKPMDMGDTDTPSALQNARKLFSEMGPVGDPKITRRQAIILITDGLAYTTNKDTSSLFADIYSEVSNNYTNILFWIVALKNVESNYMGTDLFPFKDIDSWAEQKSNQIGDKSVSNDDEDYWLTRILRVNEDFIDGKVNAAMFWGALANTHGGQLVSLEKNQADIPNTLNVVYERLLGREGFEPKCNEPFFVNAYIQSANFTFTKNNSTDNVVLRKFSSSSGSGSTVDYEILNGIVQDVSGNVLEDFRETKGLIRDDGTRAIIRYWSKIGEVEHYVITRPSAGKWVVTSTACDDIRIRYLPLNASANLIYPAGDIPPVAQEPFYDKNNPTYFEVNIAEVDGTPFQVDGSYPLAVNITYTDSNGLLIKTPDGSDTWELLGKGNGIWRSADPITVSKVGSYGISIRGTTIPADPAETTQVVVFEKIIDPAFRAPDVKLFDFRVLTPISGQVMPLNSIKNNKKVTWPIDVVVQLVDFDGKLISEPQLVINGGAPFRAVLLNENNEEMEQALLHLDVSYSGGSAYTGSLRSDEKLKLDPEGNYRIRIDLNGEWQSKNWLPTLRSKTIEISRTMRDGFSVMLLSPSSREDLFANIISSCSYINKPSDVEIKIQLIGLDGQPLRYDRVLQSPDLVGQLLQGELLGPVKPDGTRVKEALSFKIEDDVPSGNQFFVGYAGHGINETGAYEIKVDVNQDVLSEDYVKPENELTYTFSRQTTFFKQAGTCNSMTGIFIFLLISLFVFLIYLYRGPMHGQFIFYEIEGIRRSEVGTVPAAGWLNRRWLAMPGWTNINLRNMKIGKLNASPWVEIDINENENGQISQTKEWQGEVVEILNPQGELLLGATPLKDRDKSEFVLDDQRRIEIEYRE